MDSATIGDSMDAIYELDFGTHTWELNGGADLSVEYEHATVEDVIEVARDDPDCEVRIVGFDPT